MDRLRLAFIGTGNVADSYAAEVRHMADDGLRVELSAVCGRRADLVQAFAARHRVKRAETDPQAVLDAQDIDAVAILTPMQTHADLVTAALTGGKHVFSEKTLAPTAATAETLVALARTSGRILVSAPATPLSPAFAAIHGRIAAGEIGDIVSARAIYGWAGPDWVPWFYQPGAGPLRDLGIYALTTLTGLLGPVRDVAALGFLAEAQRMIGGKQHAMTEPDSVALTLGFRSGAIGTLLTGFSLQRLRVPGFEVYGTQGTLQVQGQDWDPQGYELWTNEANCWRQLEVASSWQWTNGLRDFCAAILDDRQPRLSPDHALHVLEIVDAAQVALSSGQRHPVLRDFAPLVPVPAPDATALHRKHK